MVIGPLWEALLTAAKLPGEGEERERSASSKLGVFVVASL